MAGGVPVPVCEWFMSERSDNATRTGSGRRPASAPSGDNRLVIIAVVLGVVAVVLQMVYVQWVKSEAGTDEFTVYTFAVGLERGEELREDDLEAVPVPVRFTDTFRGAIQEEDLANYLGTRLERPAQQSDLLTFELFQEPVGQTLAMELDEGESLASIPVRGERLQWLRPGDIVNLAAAFPRRGSPRPQVMPVMSNVRVLAVGERTLIDEEAGAEGRRRSFTYINFKVENEEQWLQLQQIELLANGPFFVSLRSAAEGGASSGTINPDVLEMIGQVPG